MKATNCVGVSKRMYLAVNAQEVYTQGGGIHEILSAVEWWEVSGMLRDRLSSIPEHELSPEEYEFLITRYNGR